MVINVSIAPVPWVSQEDRLHFFQEAPNFWRATANFGFMERPDIPALLQEAKERGCTILIDDVTYYVGHETVVSREDGDGLPPWAEGIYAVHGAQLIARNRLLPAAGRSSGRDRASNRDLAVERIQPPRSSVIARRRWPPWRSGSTIGDAILDCFASLAMTAAWLSLKAGWRQACAPAFPVLLSRLA